MPQPEHFSQTPSGTLPRPAVPSVRIFGVVSFCNQDTRDSPLDYNRQGYTAQQSRRKHAAARVVHQLENKLIGVEAMSLGG